jgi:transposase
MKCEDILFLCHSNPEAIVDLIENLNAHIKSLNNHIESLETELNDAKEEIRNLKALLNQNSQNSSKPPSSDVFCKEKLKVKSRRTSSGKKPGGQKGHPGKTLEMTSNPDYVIVYSPYCCENCGHNLEDTEVKGYERRQEVEIPPSCVIFTEHRCEIKECPNCGGVNCGAFPDYIKYPIQYGTRLLASFLYFRIYQLLPYERICDLVEDSYGIRISPATIKRAEKECFQNLEPFEKTAMEHLLASHSAHCDETGMRVLGTKWWLHVVSNSLWTYYFPHPKRGREAMNALGFLPKYNGVAVHDGYSSYTKYGCEHALCNAHLKRELTGIEENFEQQWAKEINELLSEMKKYTDECRELEIPIDPEKVREFEKIYDAIIQEGIEENPPPDPLKNQVKKRGRPLQTKAKNLLDRFILYKEHILRFLNDLRVPFDNNQAERDIRMMKLQQKISGTFRSIEGAVAFCRIRAYISTVRKNSLNVMDAILAALNGAPLLS